MTAVNLQHALARGNDLRKQQQEREENVRRLRDANLRTMLYNACPELWAAPDDIVLDGTKTEVVRFDLGLDPFYMACEGDDVVWFVSHRQVSRKPDDVALFLVERAESYRKNVLQAVEAVSKRMNGYPQTDLAHWQMELAAGLDGRTLTPEATDLWQQALAVWQPRHEEIKQREEQARQERDKARAQEQEKREQIHARRQDYDRAIAELAAEWQAEFPTVYEVARLTYGIADDEDNWSVCYVDPASEWGEGPGWFLVINDHKVTRTYIYHPIKLELVTISVDSMPYDLHSRVYLPDGQHVIVPWTVDLEAWKASHVWPQFEYEPVDAEVAEMER